jgi:hypothetical protein
MLSSSFMFYFMLFSLCMFYLCSPSSFIVLLLFYLQAFSHLLSLFVDLSRFIALFTFAKYL